MIHTKGTGFQTPLSDTGSPAGQQNLLAYPHWIQGVIDNDILRDYEEPLTEVVSYLTSFTKGVATRYDGSVFMGVNWDGFVKSTCGTKVWYRRNEETDRVNKILLSIPGQVCERIGGHGSGILIQSLQHCYGVRFTRLDNKLSVPKRCFSRDDLLSAIQKRAYTGVRAEPETYTRHVFDSDGNYAPDDTFRFGSLSSDSYVKIYDSTRMHPDDPNKWHIEVTHKDGEAEEVGLEYLNIDKNDAKAFAQLSADLATSKVRFTDPEAKHTRKSNSPTVHWWATLLEQVQSRVIKPRRATPVKSFQRSKKWIEKQVAQTITAMAVAFGTNDLFDYLAKVIRETKPRLSDDWHALAEEYLYFYPAAPT